MITARSARQPYVGCFVRPGFEVLGAQSIETAPGNFELVSGLGGAESQLPKTLQNVTNEGRRVSMEQLLVLFKNAAWSRTASRTSYSVGLGLAPLTQCPERNHFPPPSSHLPPINTPYNPNAQALSRSEQPKRHKLISCVRRGPLPKDALSIRPQGGAS